MKDRKSPEKVVEQVECAREEIVEFVKDLIRFRSVNSILTPDGKPLEEKQCQEFVAEELRQMGLKVDIWEHVPKLLTKYGLRYNSHRYSYKDRPMVVVVSFPIVSLLIAPTRGLRCRSQWQR